MVCNSLANKEGACCFGALIGKSFVSNQMEQSTYGIIMISIMIAILVYEEVIGSTSVIRQRVLKDQRVLLMTKTNTELRSMLHRVNKISRLNKRQQGELVVATC